MKKSKIIVAVAFVLITAFVLVNSCSKEPDCKTCHVVEYDSSDVLVKTETEVEEFCGDDLTAKEAEKVNDPVTKHYSKYVCE